MRKLQDQRGKPYQTIKVQAHVSNETNATARYVKHMLLIENLRSKNVIPVSVSFSLPVPESPLPALDFEEVDVQDELQREPSVLVERVLHKGRFTIFKKYMRGTMPWHDSLLDQQVYELNMYYQDLKGLCNVVQLEGHFQDPSGNLTFVFPELGVNMYPRHKAGIVSYVQQLLNGLDALWHKEIVHCNIKGGEKPNAIFDAAGRLTIIDFESAVRLHELIDQGIIDYDEKEETLEQEETPQYKGNLHYAAPEVFVAQHWRGPYGPTRFGCNRDVYNAGAVFVELLLDLEHLFKFQSSPGPSWSWV